MGSKEQILFATSKCCGSIWKWKRKVFADLCSGLTVFIIEYGLVYFFLSVLKIGWSKILRDEA